MTDSSQFNEAIREIADCTCPWTVELTTEKLDRVVREAQEQGNKRAVCLGTVEMRQDEGDNGNITTDILQLLGAKFKGRQIESLDQIYEIYDRNPSVTFGYVSNDNSKNHDFTIDINAPTFFYHKEMKPNEIESWHVTDCCVLDTGIKGVKLWLGGSAMHTNIHIIKQVPQAQGTGLRIGLILDLS